MKTIQIENDPEKLLQKIDQAARLFRAPEDSCTEILASAVFLAVFVPDAELRPEKLFDRLVKECGPPLDDRWVRSWALGRQGVFADTQSKALPIIRDHVVLMMDAWHKNLEAKVRAFADYCAKDDQPAEDDCD
ncbi:MAG: hypothetical protein AAB692_05435 [Patescibacteria group bacterium]